MTTTQFAAHLRTLRNRLPAAAERAGAVVAVIAAGGVKDGLTRGVSPDGTPFRPLGRGRPQGGTKPLLNTGVLRASISADADAAGLTVRANAPGARLHQTGGVIVPKRAKSLAIPVSVEAVRAGSPRNFPRPLFVLLRTDDPRGGALAERGKGRGKAAGPVVVHYLLRSKVEVPARPFLGVSAETARRIAAALLHEFARVAALPPGD